MTTEHTVVRFRQIKKKAVQFKCGKLLDIYRDLCQLPLVLNDRIFLDHANLQPNQNSCMILNSPKTKTFNRP